MDESLNQSSCEIIVNIKNLEVSGGATGEQSETSEKNRKEESSTTAESSSESSESTASSETSSKSSDTSTSSSASSESDASKKKRSRKRKRHRKKKTTTAYEPPRPFKARYKKLKLLEPTIQPKLHIRFDDETGEPDKEKSEFNFKPRIIKALAKNLSLLENFSNLVEAEIQAETEKESGEISIVSLKPRLIKAIIIS
jgi:Ulp1 family protease